MVESNTIKVLYMEDDARMAGLAQGKLEEAGYVVHVARDGEHGLAMAAADSYDVVMVDQEMPVREGLEVIRVLAARGHLAPVIMVAGAGRERVAVEAMALGARDFVVKDADGGYLELLPAVIERVLLQENLLLEKRRAEEVLQRRNRELALINRVGWALTSTLDPNEVLDTLLDQVRSLLEVVACSIWLTDSETGELVCRDSIGPERDSVIGWRLTPGQGVAGWVAQNGENLIVPDVYADNRHCTDVDQRTGLPLRSILSVPLRMKEKIIGVLQVVDTAVDRFSTDDLDLVEPIAASAAIAIENARLYEGARQDAQTLSTLVEEVNHRTRNNLTAIIGLLYAERRRLTEEDRAVVRPFVESLINQVHAMAVVHNLLASSGWASPQLSLLVSQVLQSTLKTLSGDKDISLDVASSEVCVTSIQARDLALIFNELATNTIKYALRERDTARISISIRAMTKGQGDGMANDDITVSPEGIEVEVEFRDDGPGYPEAVWQSRQYSTGLDMVQHMTRETLRGELSLHNDDGAVATLRFPVDAYQSDASSGSGR